MTFSDANPVQFWLIDCDTYNEEERYGLYNRCFCAPFECDDEIKIQFQDDENQSFTLLVYDEDESLLDDITIEETEAGVYFVSFIPSDNTPGICDKKVQLKVRKNAGTQGVSLPAFNTWTNAGGAGSPWTTGSSPSFALVGGGGDSEYLIADFAFILGVEYTVSLAYTSSASNLFSRISVAIMDGSNNLQFTNGIEVIGDTGSHTTVPITFTATASTTRIGVRLVDDTFSSLTVTLNSSSATRSLGTASIVAKSDCLYIKETHEGSILLSYSNNRNYAGIINNNGSPDLTFYLRIPAVFNEERFPEEEEPLQLSNNRIISLNSQVKAQKLLETDQMPFYMHRKMKLVLKHQFLTIEEKDYIQEEPYEEVENSNKRWPMRRYTCWLTEKEYVIRNIL